jgi:hypothetical protein
LKKASKPISERSFFKGKRNPSRKVTKKFSRMENQFCLFRVFAIGRVFESCSTHCVAVGQAGKKHKSTQKQRTKKKIFSPKEKILVRV